MGQQESTPLQAMAFNAAQMGTLGAWDSRGVYEKLLRPVLGPDMTVLVRVQRVHLTGPQLLRCTSEQSLQRHMPFLEPRQLTALWQRVQLLQQEDENANQLALISLLHKDALDLDLWESTDPMFWNTSTMKYAACRTGCQTSALLVALLVTCKLLWKQLHASKLHISKRAQTQL